MIMSPAFKKSPVGTGAPEDWLSAFGDIVWIDWESA